MMKQAIAVVVQRRQALGPPVPTAAHPEPPDDSCTTCCRSFRTRNPLINNTNPYLEPARDRSKECLPCRNGQSWGFRG
eukprot:5980081-Pyramimonas_sp.AAC.1